jgi:hypothetical protein
MKKTLFKLIYTSTAMVAFVYWVIIPIANAGYPEQYRGTDTANFGTNTGINDEVIQTGSPPKKSVELYSRLRDITFDTAPVVDQPRWNTSTPVDTNCEAQTSELQCMHCALYWEARSEKDDVAGQFLVGATILNRVRSPSYANNICGVVWADFQFSFTHDGISDVMDDPIAIKQTMSMAKEILQNDDYGTSKLGHYISPMAMWYHDDSIDPPYWAKNMTMYAKTDSFYFYRK